ncbi:hypothetical protein DLAC_03301 [Tieghemostelium lacteum]|uniref:Major facilitator superfamily (MFS) profile domain-containing protein n=1 Tax=Tieghemostelium lacteum TaxID=361077 RepID=A0A152A1S6_TIELA|nr:hypothetical protein DLAC_03301 [Tieghemostelium lacteum]|eukprot:KYR00149.1 hypothetical protein DLAC_03301 [Tieghemostelium lacteum]
MSILVNNINSNITESIININKIDVSFQDDDDDELNDLIIKDKYADEPQEQEQQQQQQEVEEDNEYLINNSYIKSSSQNSYIKTPENSDTEDELYSTPTINRNGFHHLILRDTNDDSEDGHLDTEHTDDDSDINQFETITLESSQERKMKKLVQNEQNEPEPPSPFKQLIKQKFKSFKDISPNFTAPSILDKYNTFPGIHSPSHKTLSDYGSGSHLIMANSKDSSVSSQNSTPLTFTTYSDINSQLSNTSSSSSLSTTTLPTTLTPPPKDFLTHTLLNSSNNTQQHEINLTKILPNPHPPIIPTVTRQYSLSTITRPVLESETTKVNSKILVLLSLSIFFSVSNLYYTQPLLNELGLEFQVGESIMSLVPMSVQLGYSFGLLFISTFSDIISKKKLILLLSVLTCGCLLGVGLSPHISQMIIFYFLVGLTTIIPNIAIPLAIDMTTPTDRRGILSILVSSLFVGLLGARVISGIIGHLFGWRVVFFIAAGSTLIISLSLFYFLPYTPRSSQPIPYREIMSSILKHFRSDTEIRASYFIGMCVFATFSILWTTLSFRLSEDPFNYSSGFIGLFGLIGMAGAITPLSSKLSEKFPLSHLITCYMILCAVGYLIMFLFDSHLLALIAGIFTLDLGVQSVHVSNQSRNSSIQYIQDEQMKARLNSAYLSSYFIGGALGCGLSGLIFQGWGWKGSSILGMVFIGMALSCHLIFCKNITSQQSNNNSNTSYIELDEESMQ